ncbi:MAG: peptide chain release factor N(5)-glutamine methyltransferase [candidate division WOR-3 bacterium]
MFKTIDIIRKLTRIHNLSLEEAEILLSSFLRRERHALYLDKLELRDDEYHKVLTLVKLLKKNIPIQYLLKEVQFLNWNLDIEEGVFIPRAETEGLVLLIKETLKKSPETIFDIGTGSGCIAIALAHYFPDSLIYAVDISERALSICQKNIKKFDLEERIIIKKSNLFAQLDPLLRADLIVSNPPYIKTRNLTRLPESVRYFEPWMALDGGWDGLTVIRRILQIAPRFLKPSYMIALEIDESVINELETFLRNQGIYKNYYFEKDLSNIYRYLIIERDEG